MDYNDVKSVMLNVLSDFIYNILKVFMIMMWVILTHITRRLRGWPLGGGEPRQQPRGPREQPEEPSALSISMPVGVGDSNVANDEEETHVMTQAATEAAPVTSGDEDTISSDAHFDADTRLSSTDQIDSQVPKEVG
ncbi:unnamed protein product [Calypogeia fissa]